MPYEYLDIDLFPEKRLRLNDECAYTVLSETDTESTNWDKLGSSAHDIVKGNNMEEFTISPEIFFS